MHDGSALNGRIVRDTVSLWPIEEPPRVRLDTAFT
jgi:hypothetical protein